MSQFDGKETDIAEVVEKAIKDVTEICQIDRALLMGRKRSENVAVARFFLYTILRNEEFNWSHIGKITGRDHGAVMAGVRRLEGRLICGEKLLGMVRFNLLRRGWKFDKKFYYDY